MGLGLRNDIKMLAWISRHWETSRGRVWGQFGRQRLEAMPPCPDEAKVTQGCGRWAPVLFSKSGHPECPDWQIKVSSSGPSSSVCSQPEPQSECLLAASHSARSCTQTDPRDPHSHWLRSYFYYCCFCYPSFAVVAAEISRVTRVHSSGRCQSWVQVQLLWPLSFSWPGLPLLRIPGTPPYPAGGPRPLPGAHPVLASLRTYSPNFLWNPNQALQVSSCWNVANPRSSSWHLSRKELKMVSESFPFPPNSCPPPLTHVSVCGLCLSTQVNCR